MYNASRSSLTIQGEYNMRMSIRRMIDDSYDEASRALVMGTSPATLNRARERAFHKSLAQQMQAAFAEEDVRVFSAYRRGNRADFGTEALLHDMTVCRIAYGETAERKPERLLYIAALIWQVEFDFSCQWQRALAAINRLNAGGAENKLLIAAKLESGRDSYLNTLVAPFAAGAGAQHLALIPHPSEWDSSEEQPEVWRLADGEWTALS